MFFFLSCVVIMFLSIRSIYNDTNLSLSSSVLEDDIHSPIENEEYVNNIQDIKIKVEKGDRLLDILGRYGINQNDIYELISSVEKKYNVRKIRQGQVINLTIEKNGAETKLIGFEIEIDSVSKLVFTHTDSEAFESQVINYKRFKQIVKMAGPIKGSLFATGVAQGLSTQLIMNLAYLYSDTINLNRDIGNGSEFEIVYEQFVDEKAGISHYGKILYASLVTNKNKKFNIYYYTTLSGFDGYFDDNGYSANKKQHPVLMLPLAEIRVSSSFGKRIHPISKKMSFHKGVDLVVNVGAPIWSTGDGVVEYVGNRGGYGKYIRIKHDEHYSTAYAHLSDFKKNLKVGSVVKSGEVIAYSGKTGNVTGPHLHYEVLYDGKQIDPMKARESVQRFRLIGEDLILFMGRIAKVQKIRLGVTKNIS